MVLSEGSGCLFLGGCGTSASNPLGVSGVITMKMMSSTSSTSTSGVTLISDRAPPEAPNANAMDESPVSACYVLTVARPLTAALHSCSGSAAPLVRSAVLPDQRPPRGHYPPPPPRFRTLLWRRRG